MNIKQIYTNNFELNSSQIAELKSIKPQLVLVFASISHFEHDTFIKQLCTEFNEALLIGCSTAGEIYQDGVLDNSVVLTALYFDHPDFVLVKTSLKSMDDSFDAGLRLAQQLQNFSLNNILLFGQGVNINGSALIEGLKSQLPSQTVISGGLAGDSGQFSRTFILNGEHRSTEDILALGFYGTHIQLTSACFGGWKGFGTTRRITKHIGNVLYELDGKPALELYKRYLGDYADKLPASGLLFPFSMISADGNDVGIIRTILGINEAEGSLILAGDLIDGGYLQLMHASTDALIDGAEQAAILVNSLRQHQQAGLAILVSCVGRKLLIGGRIDEEVDAVSDIFGEETIITGFYSNGEISPFSNTTDCKLHNQTMTITYLSET